MTLIYLNVVLANLKRLTCRRFRHSFYFLLCVFALPVPTNAQYYPLPEEQCPIHKAFDLYQMPQKKRLELFNSDPRCKDMLALGLCWAGMINENDLNELLDAGADVNAKASCKENDPHTRRTALESAIEDSASSLSEAFIIKLLDRGAKPTDLATRRAFSRESEIIPKKILEIDPRAVQSEVGCNIISDLARDNKKERIRFALAAGAPVDSETCKPLIKAVRSIDLYNLLLDHGADPKPEPNDLSCLNCGNIEALISKTPIEKETELLELIKRLMSLGLAPNAYSMYNAFLFNHVEVMKFLMAQGLSPLDIVAFVDEAHINSDQDSQLELAILQTIRKFEAELDQYGTSVSYKVLKFFIEEYKYNGKSGWKTRYTISGRQPRSTTSSLACYDANAGVGNPFASVQSIYDWLRVRDRTIRWAGGSSNRYHKLLALLASNGGQDPGTFCPLKQNGNDTCRRLYYNSECEMGGTLGAIYG